MISEYLIEYSSYSGFLKELNLLLKSSGITPGRLPIYSGIIPKKDREIQSEETIHLKVGKVKLYMEEHLAEELSLDKLAEEIDFSKYQLIRGFQKEVGTTPWKFLVLKRIENVKKNLEDGMSPGQAAVESGFYDQSHMNKAFREATGKTPKVYQEENFRNKN